MAAMIPWARIMRWYCVNVEKRLPIPASGLAMGDPRKELQRLGVLTIVAHGIKVVSLQVRQQESVLGKVPGPVSYRHRVGVVGDGAWVRELVWRRRHDGRFVRRGDESRLHVVGLRERDQTCPVLLVVLPPIRGCLWSRNAGIAGAKWR